MVGQLLRINSVLIVDLDHRQGPPTRIAGVIEQEIGLVYRGQEHRVAAILGFNAGVGSAHLVPVVREKALQPGLRTELIDFPNRKLLTCRLGK